MTASPMNFSTVPPWRSSSARTRSWYGRRTARTSSGSSCSAFAVKPTRSQKRTVTTFRSSRVGAVDSGASDAPHIPHRRKPSGFSWPQLGQADHGQRVRRWRASSLNSMARIKDSSVRDVVAAADMVEVVVRADAAAARVRLALHGPLPVPRGEDAVVLGEPGRQALLLLRLREGRRHHLVRPRDREPRLRRRRRVARRAVSCSDRGRGGVAARRAKRAAAASASTPCSTRRRRTSSGSSGTATRARRFASTSPGAGSARRSRRSSGSGSRRARASPRRRRSAGFTLDELKSAGLVTTRGTRLLPAAAHVPARRRARPRRRLPGAQAPRGRSAARAST